MSSRLLSIVDPLIGHVDDKQLGAALRAGFASRQTVLSDVEHFFAVVTSREWPPTSVRRFFNGWRDAVAGVASVAAMTCRVLEAAEELRGEHQVVMLRAGLACSRIIREDMGLYDTTHGDLYQRLATAVCGDEEWRAPRYRVSGAQAFHEWQREERQRGPDLEAGLIRTVATEIYNFGEFEMVAPMFRDWLKHVPRITSPEEVLEYLLAHLGDTESRHFLSIVEAHRLYGEALETPLDYARVQNRCEEFLDRVGAKYAALNEAVIQPLSGSAGS